MKALLAVVALLTTGGVQFFISPPIGWTFLHPIVWVPAFWVFSRVSGRRAFGAGWLAGSAANAVIFYWIAGTVGRFSNVPPPLAVGVVVLFAAAAGFYVGVFAWGFGRVRRVSGRWWPLGVAAWFTAVEFLNPQMFSYFQGVGWYQLPSLFLVTAFTGVSGATFLVILFNAVACQIFEALWERRVGVSEASRAWPANAGVLIALLVCAAALSALRLARIEAAEAGAESLRVALVQPNYDVVERREMRRQGPEVFADDLVALSREAAQHHAGIDVFVWPEGAISRHPRAPWNQSVLDLVREIGAEVWTGANDLRIGEDGVRRSYNSAFRIFGDGEVDERYDKNILVPFGEFMPFADLLPLLRKIRGPGNFARGDGFTVYDGELARFVFLICYEAIRADYVRQGVRKQPDLLVNLTFDAWFGESSEPSQHLMLAAAQSAQYGVPMLRSTTTGISAIVDARGRITARTGVFTREVLVRDVKKVRVSSFYARAGDWFAWACVAAAAALLVAGRARRGRGLAVAACAAGALMGCGNAAEPPRHFALITVDTLRADRLAAYGGAPGLTPHLDALAEQSQVFLRSYAPSSFTLPSVAAILTGRYPQELGIWKNESGLPASAATLAVELRARGWRTAAVVSNFVLRKSSGLAVGFDLFDDALPQREAVRKWPERIAADTTAAALTVLADCTAGTDARCFLWVHYQDPHGPYTPPGDRREGFLAAARAAPDGGRSLPVVAESVPFGGIPPYQYLEGRTDVAFYRAGYDAEVEYVDAEIGRLLAGLALLGLADQTLVVFAADHGESLGEGDYWFAHGELLTDPLVRVPLLIRDPQRSPRRRGDLVSLVDLYPTALARLAGVPPDPDRPGRDLLADGAEGAASTPYLASLGASSVERYGLVDGDYTLLVAEGDGTREESFRREGGGAGEMALETPEIAAALRAKLAAIRAKMAKSPPEIRQPLSPADREKLRALGYVAEP